MPLNTITIREKSKNGEAYTIAISFNSGPEYSVCMKDPFDLETEQLLEWYFEDYLKFPFIDTAKAERAVIAVNNYGEDLFRQVFGDRKIFSEYKKLRDSGLSSLQLWSWILDFPRMILSSIT